MREPPRPQMLIVGASTRAAAWSAWRAGWQPVCVDLFGDEDLRLIATNIVARDYPDSLVEDVASARPQGDCPVWMYTGGLENRPDVVAALDDLLAKRGTRLCGTTGAALRKLRDPAWLDSFASGLGWRRPARWRPDLHEQLPAGATWLLKPIASAGGVGIAQVDPLTIEHIGEGPPPAGQVLEQFVPGESWSALFAVGRAGAHFLGCTRQFRDWEVCRPPTEFLWCGAMTVDTIPPALMPTLERTAAALGTVEGVAGLVGIDFLWDGREGWLLEVNPRYTATVELFEHSRRSVLLPRARARARGDWALSLDSRQGLHRLAGKLVLYADREIVLEQAIVERIILGPCLRAKHRMWRWSLVSDISPAGLPIPSGAPLCTVLATARTEERLVEQLRRLASGVRDRLAKTTSS